MSLTIKELCVDLQKTRILKNINLEIRTGEFVSLLGASGCGKTTLLKSIAGLLETQEGDIRIDDTSITNLAPEKRGTVIVFQDLRLFPHMTVEKNISFSMDLKKIPKKDKQAQVGELLKAALPLPVPASVWGLILMLAALKTGVLKLSQASDAAVFLIEIMPVMFIPAGVGLMESWGELKAVLVPVLVITLVSTIVVMVVSGRVTQAVIRLEKKHKGGDAK